MAVSTTDIANQALSHIKNSTRISSFDEPTPEVDLIKLHYDTCRDEVMAASNWGFASATVAAMPLPTTVGQWAYAYSRPSDAIALRNILRTGETTQTSPENRIAYAEVAGPTDGTVAIVTDEPIAWIEYTRRIENPSAYTPDFVTALGYRLAAAIAPALTKAKGASREMMELYAQALGSARARDKNSRRVLISPRPSGIRARTQSTVRSR
ncbi:MAG: hypothetical protein AAF225_10140 [Pseudomonadota bacterium]